MMEVFLPVISMYNHSSDGFSLDSLQMSEEVMLQVYCESSLAFFHGDSLHFEFVLYMNNDGICWATLPRAGAVN